MDPLGYDKFFNDFEYVKKQYLIAEKYLNIISVPQASEEVKRQEDEIKKMRQKIDELDVTNQARFDKYEHEITELEKLANQWAATAKEQGKLEALSSVLEQVKDVSKVMDRLAKLEAIYSEKLKIKES